MDAQHTANLTAQHTRGLARKHRHGLATSLVAAVTSLLMLAGCGLRLETPEPTEPIPDAKEQVRRTAVADALGVADTAEEASTADGVSGDLATELARITADAHFHADALGGVYVSGLPTPTVDADADGQTNTDTTAPTSGDAPTGATDDSGDDSSTNGNGTSGSGEAGADDVPPAQPADVLTALTDAAARNRTAALTASDGDLARLLASIGTAQTVAATRVATLAGLEVPQRSAVVMPDPPPPADEDSPDPDATASPEAAADQAAPATSPGSDIIETAAPGDDETVVPQGLTASDYTAIVLAADNAGYALQVAAARTDGDDRDRLRNRSALHRGRAGAWAAIAGVVDTAQDPRRVAYALTNDQVGDPASLVDLLESVMAQNYASLIGTTAPGTRGILIDLLVDSSLEMNAWGIAPVTFPGFAPTPTDSPS
ncbi:MAG: ferritin-like domain-containing protein [Cellulomonadaceae bacterium]|jgi:hypothetical protein|nr:ferritin-like domain-containing protein [Cellulomonadaceae bacterium]